MARQELPGLREQTVCCAADRGFRAANGNVSDPVSISTISAGICWRWAAFRQAVWAVCARCLIQVGGSGCQIMAWDFPDQDVPTQSAWLWGLVFEELGGLGPLVFGALPCPQPPLLRLC